MHTAPFQVGAQLACAPCASGKVRAASAAVRPPARRRRVPRGERLIEKSSQGLVAFGLTAEARGLHGKTDELHDVRAILLGVLALGEGVEEPDAFRAGPGRPCCST